MSDKNKKPKKAYPYYGLNRDEATVVWLVIMVVGSIFNGNWLIWICATIWWLGHLE